MRAIRRVLIGMSFYMLLPVSIVAFVVALSTMKRTFRTDETLRASIVASIDGSSGAALVLVGSACILAGLLAYSDRALDSVAYKEAREGLAFVGLLASVVASFLFAAFAFVINYASVSLGRAQVMSVRAYVLCGAVALIAALASAIFLRYRR